MTKKPYSEMTNEQMAEEYKKNPNAVVEELQKEAEETKKKIDQKSIDGEKQFQEDSKSKNELAMMFSAGMGAYGPARQKQVLGSITTGIAIKSVSGKFGGVLQMIQGTGLMDALIKKYVGVYDAEKALKEQENNPTTAAAPTTPAMQQDAPRVPNHSNEHMATLPQNDGR